VTETISSQDCDFYRHEEVHVRVRAGDCDFYRHEEVHVRVQL
jgi:hypothetical protein